jgi:stage V sporulation protein K
VISKETFEGKNSSVDENSNFFDGYQVDTEAKKSIENQLIPSTGLVNEQADTGQKEEEVNINTYWDELHQLIGLSRVKYEIQRLINYVKIKDLRKKRGISNSSMMLHAVFYGNPGTGKTTIARLYGQMLHSLGLLSKGHFIETDRSGLVAKYVGQTAIKTDEKISEALGGVLFIDEAYSLAKGEQAQWDYGGEALEVLIKRMEDHRDDLVVIVAGYPKPMERFLNSNEGLRSRFSTFIHFDDYSPDELLEIFKLFCKKENYEIGKGALELVLGGIEYQYRNRDERFGNARFVRNYFESIIRNHAMRLGMATRNPSLLELKTIIPQDVPYIIDEGNTKSIQ